MDWSRAKTILIVIFLVLNIFLIYNLAADESKVVTISQKDIIDVQTILKRSNIELKAQVPNKIKSKSFLKVEDAPNMKFTINNEPKDNVKGFNQKKIEKYVETYLKSKDIFPEYAQVSNFTKDNNGYEIKYKQVFRDNEIFRSYMNIKLSEKGVTSIESHWFNPVGFIDDVKDIKTPLEALLVFAKDAGGEVKITIDDISLGYYLSDDIQNASVSAVPVWRIKASDGSIYYYNAYEGYLEGKN